MNYINTVFVHTLCAFSSVPNGSIALITKPIDWRRGLRSVWKEKFDTESAVLLRKLLF